jgi:glycogen phosphorylase
MDPVYAALERDVARTRGLLPAGLEGLAEVVWNVAWSWLPDGCALFEEIDAALWQTTGHNPRGVLERAPRARLAELATHPPFLARASALQEALRQRLEETPSPSGRRLLEQYAGRPVAYFCAEFGLHESLPIYSGGLGILAGDHLKSASDLGLPFVAVGLRYRQGYFRQGLDASGWQREEYPETQFGALPTGLILQEDGTPRTVAVSVQGRRVTLQMWGIRVGRVPLLLLDSDRDDNDPVDRMITTHLYGGGHDTRIAQEMLLGVGGVRALRALGYAPAVFHMNEGHAAFLTLELAREGVLSGQTWEEAVNSARAQSVFTTHTPVKAGHDAFDAGMAASYLSGYLMEFNEGAFAVSREKILSLGRGNPEDAGDPFNMTHLAMRASRSVNGVSRLHGEVSREMWHWLWPGRTAQDAPISHVTNGVHAATWIAPLLRDLLARYLGDDWEQRQADPARWAAVDRIPDDELWGVHCRLKRRLVERVRERARSAGSPCGNRAGVEALLDPEALTLGFARRVATYKRIDLLLHDARRAMALLNMPGRPVQIVIAGKAHPGDNAAKGVLQWVLGAGADPRTAGHATFVVNYDIGVAREMVQGVDVWLNVPRRPLEASGTSGMKAALNGALNCSILDGWWAEAHNGRNGWALGSAAPDPDHASQDREDAESLYSTLESAVVPLYFDRGPDGIPRRWIARVKESLKSVGPIFNTHRMVAEYAEQIYPGS